MLGAGFGKRRLGDDLGGGQAFVFQVRKFITLSEAALSEELASQVLLDADVAVELYYLFFDNNLGILVPHQLVLASLTLSVRCHGFRFFEACKFIYYSEYLNSIFILPNFRPFFPCLPSLRDGAVEVLIENSEDRGRWEAFGLGLLDFCFQAPVKQV